MFDARGSGHEGLGDGKHASLARIVYTLNKILMRDKIQYNGENRAEMCMGMIFNGDIRYGWKIPRTVRIQRECNAHRNVMRDVSAFSSTNHLDGGDTSILITDKGNH